MIYDSVHPIAPVYRFLDGDINGLPAYNALADDPFLQMVAQAYMGVPGMLDYVIMWWSPPVDAPASSESAQLFHYDLAHPKWLKFFIHLKDVNVDSGPHIVVSGTHGRDQEGKKLRKRGTARIEDKEIAAIYGNRISEIVGPAGTITAVDTRAFHKGKQPVSGDRLILQLYYTNSKHTEDTPARGFESYGRH